MTVSLRMAAIAAAGCVALATAAGPASATYFGTKDGPAIGIGSACAAVMDATARQPEQQADFTAVYREAAHAILAIGYSSLKSVPQGIALYKAAQLDGLARQPAVEPKLTVISEECANDLGALKSSSPDRAAVAIGEMCAALLGGVQRPPVAEPKMLAAYADGVDQIAALRPRSSSHVKAEATGILKAAEIEAVRGGASEDTLASIAASCEDDIRRS